MFSVVLFPQAYLRGRCISKSKIAVEVWEIGVCSFRRCKGTAIETQKAPI